MAAALLRRHEESDHRDGHVELEVALRAPNCLQVIVLLDLETDKRPHECCQYAVRHFPSTAARPAEQGAMACTGRDNGSRRQCQCSHLELVV